MSGNVRKALEKLEYGAYVITAHHGNDRGGIFANLVTQVSFDPPLVAVAIRKGRPIEAMIAESGAFALNVLSKGQMDLVHRFVRRSEPGEDRFAGVAVEVKATGSPILSDALAYLDCRLLTSYAPGDHTLFIGEVVDGDVLREGQPLTVGEVNLHYRGR